MRGRSVKFKVAICDEKKEDREIARKACEKVSDEFSVDLIINEFESGKEFLKISDEYDLLLLDTEIKDILGIEIKDILWERHSDCILIFISEHEENMQKAFGRNVDGFFTKPLNQMAFIKKVTSLFHLEKNEDLIAVHTGKKVISINVNEILYIETYQRNCRITLMNEQIIITEQISDLEKRLHSHDFFLCQKSYLIHFVHIMKIDEDILVSNGDRVQVSRRRRKELLEKYEIWKKYRYTC